MICRICTKAGGAHDSTRLITPCGFGACLTETRVHARCLDLERRQSLVHLTQCPMCRHPYTLRHVNVTSQSETTAYQRESNTQSDTRDVIQEDGEDVQFLGSDDESDTGQVGGSCSSCRCIGRSCSRLCCPSGMDEFVANQPVFTFSLFLIFTLLVAYVLDTFVPVSSRFQLLEDNRPMTFFIYTLLFVGLVIAGCFVVTTKGSHCGCGPLGCRAWHVWIVVLVLLSTLVGTTVIHHPLLDVMILCVVEHAAIVSMCTTRWLDKEVKRLAVVTLEQQHHEADLFVRGSDIATAVEQAYPSLGGQASAHAGTRTGGPVGVSGRARGQASAQSGGAKTGDKRDSRGRSRASSRADGGAGGTGRGSIREV